jgi:ABC-type nitrate/sulfonate/bicarbonate transport system substrate-binding protein
MEGSFMRRRFAPIAAFVAAILFTFGGTSAWTAEEITAVANPSLTQAAFHNLPRFAAKHGIKLSVRRMGSYTQMQQAVELGAAQVSAIGYVNLVHMAVSGGKPKAKAVSGIFVGGQNVVFHKDVKVNKWKDVEGKTIGRIPGSFVEFLFRVAAKHNGANLSKIKFKDFGFSYATMSQALKQRNVDGLVIWSPGMDMPVVDGFAYFPSISVTDTPVGNVNGLLAMNAEFMAKKPDVANKLVKAFTESTQYYASHPKEMVKAGRAITGAAVPVLQEGMKRAELTNMIYADKARLLAKIAYDGKIVKKDASGNVDNWIDYGPLMRATGKSKKDLGG